MEGLIESLSNTTVLCAVDREGTIASAIPTIDQLFFLDSNGDPVVLDLAYDPQTPTGIRFEDNDWGMHLKLLKPFGLASVQISDCGALDGKRRNEAHFKNDKMGMHGAVSTSRQSIIV